MALGWNEIKERAVKFSKEWSDTSNEEADAQSFLIEFFDVFGISRRKMATNSTKPLTLHTAHNLSLMKPNASSFFLNYTINIQLECLQGRRRKRGDR